MNIDIPNTLIRNVIIDFKKKDVCPKERANLIIKYRKKRCMSQRGLATELGIPHSTIHDWELWAKVSKEQIKQAKNAGYNMTDIYKSLRDNHELKHIHRENNVMDNILLQAATDLRYYIKKPKPTQHSITNIKELKNVLNRILMRIDK